MATDVPIINPGLSPLLLWPLVASFLAIFYSLSVAIYNITLHPLSKYPGPKLWAASRIPYALSQMSGQPHKTMLALHDRYGDTIRVAPSVLSFQSPGAWKEIMGHRKGNLQENPKDPTFIDEIRNDIISAERGNHARYRRILSHGFSAKSMQEQQPLIQGYIDLLIKRLHEISNKGPVNVVAWYSYTTFDIIGDLAFGESFGCLDNSDYHPWVKLIFQDIKYVILYSIVRSFKEFAPLLRMFKPKSFIEKREAHMQLIREKVDRRIALGAPRPDFAEAMLKRKGSEALSMDEFYGNSRILIIAGSETTASALSGATFFLASNPKVLTKLTAEIRGAYASEEEIDMASTARLEYLEAVIEETLRTYPPIPTVAPRMTPPGGQEIMGEWIPGKTRLDIWHWPMYHNEKNFSKPFGFHPERWMGDPAFANDKLEALKPFHVGPRNCLGMNLAYTELRLILARVIWNFDLRLTSESKDWVEHKVYGVWERPPLMVHMEPKKAV